MDSVASDATEFGMKPETYMGPLRGSCGHPKEGESEGEIALTPMELGWPHIPHYSGQCNADRKCYWDIRVRRA
jgi:hypothetical protein